jgi:hypothetical protein
MNPAPCVIFPCSCELAHTSLFRDRIRYLIFHEFPIEGETSMNTTPWNYDVAQAHARRALNREMAVSLITSMLLTGFVAFAVIVAEAVQESRAASPIIGASEFSVSKQQPERSGVLSAQVPVF